VIRWLRTRFPGCFFFFFFGVVVFCWLDNLRGCAQRLFRLLNVSGTGRVTKAEVVCGFLLIVDGSIEQKLEMLFHSFDKAGRGRLTRPAVLRLIITLLTMAYDQGTKSTDPGYVVCNRLEHEAVQLCSCAYVHL